MLLTEFLDNLAYGELSGLYMGSGNSGRIHQEELPKLITYINHGLTDLYTRFRLKSSEVIVEQQAGQTIYELHSKYAVTNTESVEPVKYIIDSAAYPFSDDIIKIFQAFAENGDELPLNNQEVENGVYTLSYNVVQIPIIEIGDAVSLLYQANHHKLNYLDRSSLTQSIELPTYLIEPLLMFVGSKAISKLGSESGMTEGQLLMQKYELALQQIKTNGALNEINYGYDRLRSNGWV